MIRLTIAVVVLVAIGATEATVSAGQLAAFAGRPQLGSGGVLLSAAGLLASAATYLLLGRAARTEGDAVRAGAVTGLLAGVVGGGLRALILSDVVAAAVARYADVPEWFVPAALTGFVLLSAVVSIGGGTALAWIGRRLRGRGPC